MTPAPDDFCLAHPHMTTMDLFDYSQPAETFASKYRIARRATVSYRRFDCTATAIRYLMEELPTELLPGAYLEVGDQRLGAAEIKSLYEAAAYPLTRRKANGA